MPEKIPDDLICIKAAARILGVHAATVYLVIRKGQLRGWRRIGGTTRVSQAEVEALMQPVQVHATCQLPRVATEEERDADAAVERLRAKGYKAG